MITILREEDYDTWLSAAPEDSHQFLYQYPADALEVSGTQSYKR